MNDDILYDIQNTLEDIKSLLIKIVDNIPEKPVHPRFNIIDPASGNSVFQQATKDWEERLDDIDAKLEEINKEVDQMPKSIPIVSAFPQVTEEPFGRPPNS